MSPFREKAEELRKSCTDDDAARLQKETSHIDQLLHKVKQNVSSKIKQFDSQLKLREEIGNTIEKCQTWAEEADVATSADLRGTNNPEVLVEQLAKVSD